MGWMLVWIRFCAPCLRFALFEAGLQRKATEPEPQVASAPPPSPSPVGRGNRPYLGLTMWHLFEVHPLNSNIISW